MKNTFLLLAILSLVIFSLSAQDQPKDPEYLNADLPLEARVEALLSAMTPEEKISQLVNNAPAIPRLQVPQYNWWNESLHGVARAGYATVFPQSITVAASFDQDLLFRIGSITSDEARAKHHEFVRQGKREIYQGLTFWSPNINIFRDPRWGRGHETYGEDPYLTGTLAVQFIKGLQGDDPNYLKVVATAKHYAVHSGPEPLRHSFDVDVSDVDLFETYLPAFHQTVVEGKVQSIMGAYNRFRGESCVAHPLLLDTILRQQWGFDGYIVSDCGAIHDIYAGHHLVATREEAAALGVRSGCDLNCGSVYKSLPEALRQGLLTVADIDAVLRRLLRARFRLGMFDPPERVPYAQIPFTALGSSYNRSVAREAAQKSIVLLKNEGQTLPLSKTGLKKIAVVGPNADNWEALIGNYNGIPRDPVTALQGIRNKVEPRIEVLYAQGSDLAQGIHNLQVIPSCYFLTEDGRQGLRGEYFANKTMEGMPVFTKVDDQIDFYWEQASPDPRLPDNDYAIRWSGYLVPEVSGIYHLGQWAMSQSRIYLDGKEFLNFNNDHHGFHQEKTVSLEAGKRYALRVEYVNRVGDGDIRLLWSTPRRDPLNEAVRVAGEADAVVVVLGLSQRLEGEEMGIRIEGFEGGDRTSLRLPREQEALLEAMCQTGKPVVVVVMAGSALALNYAQEHAGAILYAGYPGEEGGNAIADVLFGDFNPGGRLPVTYYQSVDQLPPFEDYNMQGRTYRYFREEPLYPFGYGLSYTAFTYSDLHLPQAVKADAPLEITVKVTNSGSRAGDEVIQLYLTDEEGSTPRPIRQLEGFQRIFLEAGESREVKFTLRPDQLSMIDRGGQRTIEKGWFTIAVGGKQPGFTGYLDPPTTQVLTGRVKME